MREYLQLDESERKSSKILSKKELGQLKNQGDIISALLKHDLDKLRLLIKNALRAFVPGSRTRGEGSYFLFLDAPNPSQCRREFVGGVLSPTGDSDSPF